MRAVVIVLFVAAALSAVADEFSLIDEYGRKHGPVELKEGATVDTVVQQLTITDVRKPDEGLKAQLMEIMVPDLTFDGADLDEVVRLFADASRKYDDSPGFEKGKGVTFTVLLDYDGEHVAGGQPARWREEIRKAEVRGKLTAKTRNAPLWSALEAVLAQFDAKPLAREGIVLIVDWNAAEAPIVVKKYDVRPSLLHRIREGSAALNQEKQTASDVKTFFESMGVKWPNGSSVQYVPSVGQLVVANTLGNLRVLDGILDLHPYQPTQIEIEVQFVAFKKSDIAAIAVKGMVGDEELRELRRQGKSELLACPKVITKSGSEAVIKSVKEYVYPTEFTASSVESTNTNHVAVLIGAVVEPSGFEMREVGAILEVAPDVSPEGRLIDLTFTPQLVQEPEWEDYGCDIKGKDGKKYRLPMKQPFFFSHTISTSVSLFAGESTFIGGGASDKDPEKIVYIFASARLVRCDGKPLKRRK